MSLVRTSARVQRLAGALVIALVGGGVAGVLALSGRTLGPGVHFFVELKTTGALRPNARIKLAGRDVGEVRTLGHGGEHGHVIAECFVARPWNQHLRANSDLFVATPSILGESWLEIAPPRDADPGPELADGAHVRGSDPPQLDELIGRVYGASREIIALTKEHGPELDKLLVAWARLSSTLSDVGLDDALIARLKSRTRSAVDDGKALADVVRDEHLRDHAVGAQRELEALDGAASPKLRQLSRAADELAASVDALGTLVPVDKRAEITDAVAQLRAAAKAGEAMVATLEGLGDYVVRGDGTVGGFLNDKELFDDFHEGHRILKHQPWTLIVKPPKGKKTIAR